MVKKLSSLILSLSLICIPAHALVWEFLCGAASGVTGVDIYVPQEYFMPKEQEQPTTVQQNINLLLFQAIEENDLKKMQVLIEEHGADVNSTLMAKNNDFSTTPLMWAIKHGSAVKGYEKEIMPPILVSDMEEMVRILLKAGADVKATNSLGETALVAAAKNSARVPLRVFRLLIEAGSDLNWEDDFPGLTALDYARKNNDVELVQLMEETQQQTSNDHKNRYTVEPNPVQRAIHDRVSNFRVFNYRRINS